MDIPFFKIGSKISIISKANVRYEGVFLEIDTDNLQIALSDVRFYGTESRNAAVFIAGQDRMYPCVIFKSSDINDIRVLDEIDDGPDQLVEPPVEINQYGRRDYPQSTLEFLRTYPFGQFGNSSSNSLQTPIHASALQRACNTPRSYWSRYGMSPNGSRGAYQRPRKASYSWRIPRVNDFISRSGDPNELPIFESSSSSSSASKDLLYKKEFDFEKNNKLFENLLQGMNDLSLARAYDENDGGSTDSKEHEEEEQEDDDEGRHSSDGEQSNRQDTTTEEQLIIEKTVSSSSQGATPKKYKEVEAKPHLAPTAYNRAKSFFDTVSCASIYRSPNSNPNWREWNKETFGIPMINHLRRKRRIPLNAIKRTERFTDNESIKIAEKAAITDESSNMSSTTTTLSSAPTTERNVSVQKIRFQAVVVTKTRGNKISIEGTKKAKFEKNSNNEVKAIERCDSAEQYSLNGYK